MTNKEAIEKLQNYKKDFISAFQSNSHTFYGKKQLDEDVEAIDAAIKALEQEPKTAYWVEYKPDHHKCSKCGKDAFAKWDNSKRDNINVLTNCCPNCGAKMEETEGDGI